MKDKFLTFLGKIFFLIILKKKLKQKGMIVIYSHVIDPSSDCWFFGSNNFKQLIVAADAVSDSIVRNKEYYGHTEKVIIKIGKFIKSISYRGFVLAKYKEQK